MSQAPTKYPNVTPLVEADRAPSQPFRQWEQRVSKTVPIVGTGTPEGVVEAPQYSIYIDETTPTAPTVYRKMLADIGGDRSKGWISSVAMDSLTLTGNDSLKLTGDATAWDDIQTSLIGRRLSSTAGSVNYNYTENTVDFSGGGVITNTNDTVVFNIQTRHRMLEDSSLNLHMHFEQSDATNRTMTVRYRIQDNGSAKTATWTTVTADTDDSVFTWSSGTLNNILPITSIDLTGIGISAIVQIQMTRTDANGGTLPVTFVDAHFQADSLGSNDEYSD